MGPDVEAALDVARRSNAEFQFTYVNLSPQQQAIVDTMWKAGYLQGWMDKMNALQPTKEA